MLLLMMIEITKYKKIISPNFKQQNCKYLHNVKLPEPNNDTMLMHFTIHIVRNLKYFQNILKYVLKTLFIRI